MPVLSIAHALKGVSRSFGFTRYEHAALLKHALFKLIDVDYVGSSRHARQLLQNAFTMAPAS